MRSQFKIVAIALMFLVSACGSAEYIVSDGTSDPLDSYMTGYLPFVEQVSLPSSIHAGEEFIVTLHLSAVLKPALFQGADMHSFFTPVGLVPTNAPADGYLIDTWMHLALLHPSAPYFDRIEITMPPLPAGDWSIGVWQLQDRAQGGREGNYQVSPRPGADRTGQEIIYYPITVIERPET